MSSCTSTPGTDSATSTLMTSSSRGGATVSGRGPQPLGKLPATGRGDPEALLRALALRVVGLDQPVALQALQGGVDLPHVERPDLAGPGLELLPQLQAVLRALAQQGQQRVPNTHEHLPERYTQYILGILCGVQRGAGFLLGWPASSCGESCGCG